MYANFKLNKDKCIKCYNCLNVCPGNMVGGDVLRIENGYPIMVDQNSFGWKGCWKCQHCMAICPTSAISIFNIDPLTLPNKPNEDISIELSNLIKYRRSCRAFKKEDVDINIINNIIDAVENVPTGGNNISLEFSIIEKRNKMEELYKIIFNNFQPSLFNDNFDLSALRLYDAPHLFIAHKKLDNRFNDGALTEMGISSAYFELMANSYKLGTIISTYAAELISSNKDAKAFLGIPNDHKILTVIGFGYPKYIYQRGVNKHKKVNHIK